VVSKVLPRLRHLLEEGLAGLRPKSAEQRRHEADVHRAVEQVVDQVNPRLRAVSGYRRRLFPVVEKTLAYAGELAARAPEPLLFDRQRWAQDPRVNALFGDLEGMRRVLTGPEVRRFLRDRPLGGDCYAMLASAPDLRTQLGMELAGEAVQRDVRQTTLSFSDHQILLAGETEAEVRGRLAALATETLVGIAVEDILLREARITELDDRLRIVRIKARALEARSRGAAFDPAGGTAQLREAASLRARAGELEQELAGARAGLEGLEDYLDRLIERLARPEDRLSLKEVRLRLDRMNIVRAGGTDADSNEIVFHRVQRGDAPARVIHLIRFPRSELLEDRERLRGIETYL
jgi:hypothetical protein